MTPEDWTAIFTAQGGRCYLCRDPLEVQENGLKRGENVHIEHDHRCCPTKRSCARCRRGLSCPRCNLLIGRVADDPALLRLIADNLEKALNLLELETVQSKSS